ncbi:MAG: hypothetical protein IJA15_05870, partial [Clostridia bacterium]|nr:hypothetical protein [Clostridia bacterium]
NYAIIVSGEGLKAISVTSGTTVNSNNVAFTSLASFYANSDETVFDSTLWKFERGEYPHIANLSAEVEASVSEMEISAGLSANAQFTSDRAMIISSDTAGVVYANGVVSVAAEVAPGTVATITAYCAYDKTKVATITVTVKAATIEVSAEVEEIVNDKFVLGTEKTYNLGISVTSNGAAVEGYQVASSNVAVVTVENGVAKLVGDGSANITVTHEGTTLLTIPVSVVAYNPIYTTAEFLAMGTNVETMSKNYILMNDLDFGGAQIKSFCAWQTHSTHQVRWYGIFDGDGHTVSNFTSMWNDWAGTAWAATGNRDRGIFGYMWEGSVVRNVSFLNVKTGDRCGVVANFATNGALIENVYVEATVTKDGVNTNANNPAGVLVQKVTAGGIVRNCVVKLTVEQGVKADVDSKNATAWSHRAAAVGQISGTVDNVQVIYNPFEGQALPFNLTGSATNSAIYATVADFYANANLELYDSSIWNFNAEEGYYPYVGTISAIAVDQAELEVPAGMNAALAVNATAGYSVSSNVEGVAFSNGKVTVAEDVPAGTEATLTFTCLYTGNTATVKVTVSAMTIETITAVTEITNDKFVLGTEETYELNVIVKVNGVETENYEVASSNAAVVTVENGVAKLVGNGSANIVISYNGSTLVEIPVSVVAYTGIYNREQFEAIFSNQSGKYMLMNDLDFQGATHYAFGSWKYGHDDPTLAFKGVFDGNGHAIKNVVIGVDNRHAAVQTDASIFGTVFGTVRNLAVINATVTNRGGVIASGIGAGGKIENCYVECTVKSVTAAAAANDFGPIAFRAQANSQAIDCISVVNILEGVPTTYIGGIVGMNLSKAINNCQAIVVSGQALPTHSTEHGTVKPGPVINSAVYTSLAAFYAGANLELFTSDLWSFEEGLYPNFGTLTNTITFDQEVVEVPAGMSMPVAVSADLSYSVSSNVEGVAFANGKVAVADSVPAETEATLTFTCLYTGATATLKVKVIDLVIEGSSAITSISNDKFVLGTDKTYDLGIQVTLNGVETENYEVTSSNAAVVTVENGVAKLVGGGSANIVVSYNGATVLEIPVSVVAYTGVYTVADFEAIYSNQAGKYMLMNDIDFGGAEFNAFSGWGSAFETPSKSAFTGIFDGNGYALKNIIPKHDGARHPSDTTTDASIFGVIGAGGVIRNLKVNAIIKYRGGVVASLINGGLVENCYVECTVAPSLAGLTASNNFGGVVFRTQANGTMKNCICVMTLEKGENDVTVNTTMVGGVHGIRVGTVNNCFSIIASGETLTPILQTHGSAKVGGDVNNASFVSYDAFFAAEGGADYSAYNTSIWAIDAENGTIGLIAGCSVK